MTQAAFRDDFDDRGLAKARFEAIALPPAAVTPRLGGDTAAAMLSEAMAEADLLVARAAELDADLLVITPQACEELDPWTRRIAARAPCNLLVCGT